METERTETVNNCNWVLKQQLEVFPSKSSVITETKANQILASRRKSSGTKKIQNRQVLLKMLPVNWLFVPSYDGGKSGRKSLVTALANAPHESLFSTDLVITLVESFWASYSS